MTLRKLQNHIRASALGMAWTVATFPIGVLAAKPEACGQTVGGFLGFPTWYKYLNPTFSNGECNISFNILTSGGLSDLPKVLLAIFEIILRVGGLAAVGFVIYGGIQYMISQGEPEKTKGARTTIINALVGLGISMSAVAIVNVIGRNL